MEFNNNLLIQFLAGTIVKSIASKEYYSTTIDFPIAFNTTFSCSFMVSGSCFCLDVGGSSMAELSIGAYNVASNARNFGRYHVIAIGY